MSMRDFLRGGYQQLDEGTTVMRHGRPVFTVFPYTETNFGKKALETAENGLKSAADLVQTLEMRKSPRRRI